MDIALWLREVSDGYADRLSPAIRRRLVLAGVQSAASNRAPDIQVIRLRRRLIAAAASCSVILGALMLLQARKAPPTDEAPISDLTATRVGDEVVLTWTDGDQARQVVRVTNREELARLQELRGEVAVGKRWVDRRASEATIVFYDVR